MALRKRVSLAAAVAVGVAVVLVSMVAYLIVRNQLRGQIDNELKAQASRIEQGDQAALMSSSGFPSIPASSGGPAPYIQAVAAGGDIIDLSQYGRNVQLPVSSETLRIADGDAGTTLSDVTLGGAEMRMITIHVTGTYYNQSAQANEPIQAAVEIARPLGPIDSVLANLRLFLLFVCVLGIALATALGRLAARRVLSPLAEVTETAKTIGETDDLSLRLAVHADDEVGQLATRFNEMLERLDSSRAALDDSVRSQRQLVADASHELRTPVTSLRTNIEVLLAGGRLDDEDRERLLADVVEQSEELTTLVSDLIEVARGDLPSGGMDDTRLDRVAEESLARARRNAPDVEFRASIVPTIVSGNPERLSRAINNLLDNASRHTAPGTPVELVVDSHGVQVRDHGSGIDEEDLPYVFDRFYRGANSRARQGSGLGLAIVRQVAESHGGSISAANAPDGGAIFTLTLPVAPVPPDEPDDSFYDAGGLVTRA
jgi:two-component system, OmpR family, sensor histidine kinase MprB